MVKQARYGELKPCPFCGEAHNLYFEQYQHGDAEQRWRVICARCMAQIDRGYDKTTAGLVEAWNRRRGAV